MSIRALVCDYLQTLQNGGVVRLPIDDEARAVLRAWMLARKNGTKLPSAPPPAAPPVNEMQAAIAALREAVEQQAQPEVEEEVFFRPAGRTPEELWKQAERLLQSWAPLQKLGTLRKKPVWGEGSRVADIMLVGEAPSYYDELEGRPFCGEAGGKLDGILKAMELSRSQVYITHLVKFRPLAPNQTINTRAPSREEVRVSLPVLDFEIAQVRPKVIVAMGVIAARALLRCDDLPLSACKELPHAAYNGTPLVVTHTPGYLLRTTSVPERRRLWEDMLRVMEMAGLPISAKQRGYFLPKK